MTEAEARLRFQIASEAERRQFMIDALRILRKAIHDGELTHDEIMRRLDQKLRIGKITTEN